MQNCLFYYRRSLVMAILSLALVVVAFPQSKKTAMRQKAVPAEVLAAFHNSYPAAVIKVTSREKENGVVLYEIESVDGSVRRDLLYAPDGSVREVEESVPTDSLPPAVRAALDKAFPHAIIKTSERLIKDEVTAFEFSLKDGKRVTEVTIDPSGTILKGKPEGKKGDDGEKEDDDEDEEN
jgi:hypothetical protein